MNGIKQRLLVSIRRQLHLHMQMREYSLQHNHEAAPTETLKRKMKDLEKKKKSNNIKRDKKFFVETPESKSYLDTATMPMILTAVGIALFAKLLMMVCTTPLTGIQFKALCFLLFLFIWVAFIPFDQCPQ